MTNIINKITKKQLLVLLTSGLHCGSSVYLSNMRSPHMTTVIHT